MSRHSYIRMTKLNDVRGRIDYISNPKRQEHLYGTYTTVKPEFWELLAVQSKLDFLKSNQKKGKCTEARELVIALPESFQQMDAEYSSVGNRAIDIEKGRNGNHPRKAEGVCGL